MNLLIAGYYRFEDGYKAYGDYFKNHFSTVSFFPLMELIDRLNENSTEHSLNDLETMISGNPFDSNRILKNGFPLYTKYLINYEVPKNVIIITHSNMTLREKLTDFMQKFDELKQKYNFKLCLIDWDPVLTPELIDKTILSKFDICFCADPYYAKHFDNCQFFKAGYNENYSFYEFDKNYICDVVFVGTNLYEHDVYPNKTVTRREVLDAIYSDKNIRLHIYGNDDFKEIYPDSYKGILKYNDSRKAFSNAKICLNISHFADLEEHDEHKKSCSTDTIFYSDRVAQIQGCGSIMLSNNDFGSILQKNVDYIHVSKMEDLMPKIYYHLYCKEQRIKMKIAIKELKNKFEYENTVREMYEKIFNIGKNSSVDK